MCQGKVQQICGLFLFGRMRRAVFGSRRDVLEETQLKPKLESCPYLDVQGGSEPAIIAVGLATNCLVWSYIPAAALKD
jgi:hypothetical protein